MRIRSSVSVAPRARGGDDRRGGCRAPRTRSRNIPGELVLGIGHCESSSSDATTAAFTRPASQLSAGPRRMLACAPTTRQRSVAERRRASQRAATRPESSRATVARPQHDHVLVASSSTVVAPSRNSHSSSVCMAPIRSSAGASSSVVFLARARRARTGPRPCARRTTSGTRKSTIAAGVPSDMSGSTTTTIAAAASPSASGERPPVEALAQRGRRNGRALGDRRAAVAHVAGQRPGPAAEPPGPHRGPCAAPARNLPWSPSHSDACDSNRASGPGRVPAPATLPADSRLRSQSERKRVIHPSSRRRRPSPVRRDLVLRRSYRRGSLRHAV